MKRYNQCGGQEQKKTATEMGGLREEGHGRIGRGVNNEGWGQ